MKIISLFIFFIIICLLCLFLSCYDYYTAEYHPSALAKESIEDYPESFFITGIPWISSNKAYCNSTCLQMIGEWKGIHKPVAYYNWLMGHTYGGFYKDSFKSFIPLANPMKGIMFASEYMGLKRLLYSTNDKELCVRAIKAHIVKGLPVFLMLDYNAFTNENFLFPHAEILVGYAEDSFYYYEPGFAERYELKSKGQKESISTFMKAVENFNKYMEIPAKYDFMVFENAPIKSDTDLVWKRNASILQGNKIGFVNLAEGSEAFIALAQEIVNKDIPDWGWNTVLKFCLGVGKYTREDNAKYLQSNFSDNKTLLKAADLFLESAAYFKNILILIEDSYPKDKTQKQKIADLLLSIAEKEKLISELLLSFN
jgi:hypothetical protein